MGHQYFWYLFQLQETKLGLFIFHTIMVEMSMCSIYHNKLIFGMKYMVYFTRRAGKYKILIPRDGKKNTFPSGELQLLR